MPRWARPILADNGSTDASVAIARSRGVQVVEVPQRGYGAACHAGLMAATAPLVAFMDADASLDPGSLEVLLRRPSGRPERGTSPPRGRRPTARLPCRLAAAAAAGEPGAGPPGPSRAPGCELDDIGPAAAGRHRALQDLAIGDRRSGYPVETVLRAAGPAGR